MANNNEYINIDSNLSEHNEANYGINNENGNNLTSKNNDVNKTESNQLSDINIDEDIINLVIYEVKCTRQQAIDGLIKNDMDVVGAILSLSQI